MVEIYLFEVYNVLNCGVVEDLWSVGYVFCVC